MSYTLGFATRVKPASPRQKKYPAAAPHTRTRDKTDTDNLFDAVIALLAAISSRLKKCDEPPRRQDTKGKTENGVSKQ
jgi:hypothetical protein